MAKNQSDKSRYPSRYSPNGWVHAAQYVTELICEKKSKFDDRNNELPIKFWELKEWNKYFRYQISVANSLIKKYGESPVIAALHDKRAYKVYSLKNKFLEKIIKEYKNRKEDTQKIVKEIKYGFSKNKTFETNNNKKSIISRLKDLE